jgi:AcrR family transcriptional regulator
MDVREKLLSAAARIYAEAGYRGATTRRIAQGAGVNEITLFRHFGSKDALLLEATRHFGMVASLPPLPDAPVDPEQELGDWCRTQHAVLYEKRSFIRMCMGEMAEHPEMGRPATAGPCLAATMLRDYFVRLRERGIATADFDPDAVAWMLLAVIFADAMWRDVMTGNGTGKMRWKPAGDAMSECVRLVLRAVGVPVSARGRAGRRRASKPRRPHARSA